MTATPHNCSTCYHWRTRDRAEAESAMCGIWRTHADGTAYQQRTGPTNHCYDWRKNITMHVIAPSADPINADIYE